MKDILHSTTMVQRRKLLSEGCSGQNVKAFVLQLTLEPFGKYSHCMGCPAEPSTNIWIRFYLGSESFPSSVLSVLRYVFFGCCCNECVIKTVIFTTFKHFRFQCQFFTWEKLGRSSESHYFLASVMKLFSIHRTISLLAQPYAFWSRIFPVLSGEAIPVTATSVVRHASQYLSTRRTPWVLEPCHTTFWGQEGSVITSRPSKEYIGTCVLNWPPWPEKIESQLLKSTWPLRFTIGRLYRSAFLTMVERSCRWVDKNAR